MRILTLAAVMLTSAADCGAQPSPAMTGHPGIDAFVADVAAGRRAAAVAKLSSIESASGEPNAAATPAEFVDKLLQCTYLSSRAYPRMPAWYDIIWSCPDGDYWSLMDVDYRPPRLTVGQFVSTATREEWRKRSPAPAPPPPARNPAGSKK